MARLDDRPVPAGPPARSGPAAPNAAAAALPRRVRWYLGTFLAAFALCGVFGVEAWPLTGWRLFADARQAEQPGWQLRMVDRGGREHPVPFRELPAGHQGHVQVLRGFPALPAARQAAVCQAWARALLDRGVHPAELRLYATVTDVSDRRGRVGAPPRRSLRHVCRLEPGPGGVRARLQPLAPSPGPPDG
jgi:hypothetical protein